MIYYVPDMTLGETLKFANTLETIVPDDGMVFDFSKMSNFDPLPMLMLGAIMRSYRKQFSEMPFSITGIDTAGKSYAGTIGFFKYVSTSLGIGKMPSEAQIIFRLHLLLLMNSKKLNMSKGTTWPSVI